MFRILCLAGLLLLPSTLQAAPQVCADHSEIVRQLRDRYGEERLSVGLTTANHMIELFASSETGTWTITLTAPGGPTCLVAAGSDFRQLPQGVTS